MTEEKTLLDPIQTLADKLDKEFKPRCQCPCGTLIYGKSDAEGLKRYSFHLEFFHVDIRPETRKEFYR